MRPACRKKLGFVPCPPPAIDALLKRLIPPSAPQHTALLDPCSGAGAALKQIASGLGISDDRLWMVELDEERGNSCRELMPAASVLSPCSFLQTEIRTGSFSLVYCNPPFDDSLTRGVRVEEQFLSRALTLLCTGGVLVFVCPESIAERSGFQGILATYCRNIDIIQFQREVRKHQEVFVIAQRIEGFRAERCAWRDVLARGNGRYSIPKAPGPGARFKKTGLTDDELEQHLSRSPLLGEFAAPPEFTLPRPPLALGKGHLALLLAAGHLDGLVSVNGHSHVVRGVAKKVEEVTDQEVDKTKGQTTTKTTYTEKIKLSIRAVWPDGVIRNLE